MRIEIINEEGDLITSLELESNPFKIGEVIHVSIINDDKVFWTREEMNQYFKIEKIQHYSKQIYLTKEKYHSFFTTELTVSKNY